MHREISFTIIFYCFINFIKQNYAVEKIARQNEKAPGNPEGIGFQNYLWEFIDYMQQLGYETVDAMNNGDYEKLSN